MRRFDRRSRSPADFEKERVKDSIADDKRENSHLRSHRTLGGKSKKASPMTRGRIPIFEATELCRVSQTSIADDRREKSHLRSHRTLLALSTWFERVDMQLKRCSLRQNRLRSRKECNCTINLEQGGIHSPPRLYGVVNPD